MTRPWTLPTTSTGCPEEGVKIHRINGGRAPLWAYPSSSFCSPSLGDLHATQYVTSVAQVALHWDYWNTLSKSLYCALWGCNQAESACLHWWIGCPERTHSLGILQLQHGERGHALPQTSAHTDLQTAPVRCHPAGLTRIATQPLGAPCLSDQKPWMQRTRMEVMMRAGPWACSLSPSASDC